MFVSHNYLLAYQPKDEEDPVAMVWDDQLVPYIPGFRDINYLCYNDGIVLVEPPLVNVESSAYVIDNIIDCWTKIPNLITIGGSLATEPDHFSSEEVAEFIHELLESTQIVQSDILSIVDWEKISVILNQEQYRWIHLLQCAWERYPDSVELAPIFPVGIVNTIINYNRLTNWVMTIAKITPLKTQDFVLLRYN